MQGDWSCNCNQTKAPGCQTECTGHVPTSGKGIANCYILKAIWSSWDHQGSGMDDITMGFAKLKYHFFVDYFCNELACQPRNVLIGLIYIYI